jgi:flavin reductase (DIM6/NTAB) family NADH-FMN oxidoreductase RutF
MESLLIIGGKFAVSTIPEGGADRLVMKKLARSFQPGEDRLAGLETIEGEVTGAPILKVKTFNAGAYQIFTCKTCSLCAVRAKSVR